MQSKPTQAHAGPFIVTTKRPVGVSKSLAPACKASRRAVATLAEASAVIDATLPEEIGTPKVCIAIAKQIVALTDAGGSVGPLPDGTVIEVARISWEELAEETDGWTSNVDEHTTWPEVEPRILAAYNAKQEADHG